MNHALVWFRLDLRVADNPALAQAVAAHDAVTPVFIWAPEEETPWAPGGASRWWLHQSLRAFQADLAARNSRLILRRGPTADVLMTLAAETGARAVYWNRRYEPAMIARDREIQRRFREAGLAAEGFPGNLLYEPGTVANREGKPFRVFTAFWRAWRSMPAPALSLDAPTRLPSPERWPDSLPLADLALEPKIDWAAGLRETWQPGEAGALQQLNAFLRDHVDAYTAERDRPDHEGTSRLSPHLHFGEISARQVWHALSPHPNAEPYLRQIAWREFAYHLLFHFPQTPNEALRPEFRRFPWQLDPRMLHAWTRGRTGYPFVDAGMRELWRTGWMHNRVRMVTASFLVKHLLIPWQEGARWFWDTLVDADLANNTLGWQWCAGCGADAAPYFRIFNPVLQGEKFDPAGAYVRRWIPELARLPDAWIHKPAPREVLAAAGVELGRTYPAQVVDHQAARERALAALAGIVKSGGHPIA